MKRKDTYLRIISDINISTFDTDNLMQELNELAVDITYFDNKSKLISHWDVELEDITITDTSLEQFKVVKFLYKLNYKSSNYENTILMKMCINLNNFFKAQNKNSFIESVYNSRLDK